MTHQLIGEIMRTGRVMDGEGQTYPLVGGIDQDEGAFLQKLIVEQKAKRSLEVGCAYGISSLYICGALADQKGAHHLIVDPYQSTQWRNIGVVNLERAGVSFYKLIEEPSELALPQLVKAGTTIDFALIDGWHTFDQALVDFYFLNRMLEVGGIVVFDDADWPSINKVVRYISNYPGYRILGSANQFRSRNRKLLNSFKRLYSLLALPLPQWLARELFDDSVLRSDGSLGLNTTMIALQKTSADDRSYDWYVPV